MSEKIISENNKQNTNLLFSNNVVKYSYYLNNSLKDINTKNKKVSNKNVYNGKKLKINLVPKLEYLYSDSQDRTTATNKNNKLKKKNKINLSTKEKNSTYVISYTNNINNNNKDISRQNKKNKLKRSQTSFDNFWNKIKEHEQFKINKFNNIKTELINKEISELRSYPQISKRTKYLANIKQRESLFLNRAKSEERNLTFNFNSFYKMNIDIIDKEKEILSNERIVKKKFDEFYEDNMRWKKYKDELNEKIKYDNMKKNENDVNKNLTFRPLLSKNTKKIIKKMGKNKRELNLNHLNNLYNNTNEREILNKLKLQLKPVLSEVFDINHTKRPYITKKSYYLADNSSEKNKKKNLNRNKTYNNIIPTKKINKKETEKKISTKKEKVNEPIDDYEKKRNYEYYLLQKFREIKNPFLRKKKELYKLNVRQATAWNQEFVNNILPKKKYGFIIEGLL